MKKKKYLVGIQPTGKLHIGNYLGCLKKGLELQNDGHDVTFLIANYHSITTNSFTSETEKELVKLGCSKIVHQTPDYLELFFKLCCKMNLGSLTNMPQYKDKKEENEYDLGILLYPALMTADIVINDPDVVLVGKDQVPHLELCNEVAKRIGGKRRYEYEFGSVDKVMSLFEPEKKMSKSLGEKHVLYLYDEDYETKLKKATATDAGILNLKTIARGLGIYEEFEMNSELKSQIGRRMTELFNK